MEADQKTRAGEEQQARERTLGKLYLIYTTFWCCIQVYNDAKMLVYLRDYNGDTAKYTYVTSRLYVICYGTCMAVSPLLGQLADTKGRVPVMRFCAFWNLLLRVADIARPRATTAITTTLLAPPIMGLSQLLNTGIGDLFPGDPKGAGGAMARLQIGQVAGLLVFPYVGAVLAARDLRLPLAVSALFAVVTVLLAIRVPETLPPEKRSPKIDLKKITPLAPFRLFLYGPKLALVTLAQILLGFLDPMLFLSRYNVLLNMPTLGWTIVECGRFTSLGNACSIPGLYGAGRSVKALGAIPCLLLGAGAIVCEHLLEALWVVRPGQLFFTLPLYAFRGMNTAALSTVFLEAGEAAGLRQAELLGCQQGLTMFVWAAGGVVWASWYDRVLKTGKPRNFYLGPAAVAAAQLLAGLLSAALPAGAAAKKTKEEEEDGPVRERGAGTLRPKFPYETFEQIRGRWALGPSPGRR